MYVCLCRGVTERTVARALADGAHTVEELAARTGAGTRCGTCRSMLTQMAAAARDGTERCIGGGDCASCPSREAPLESRAA